MQVNWRNLRNELETQCQTIYKGRVLLCVSAGVDSMFLLDFMSKCKIDFDVVHFQHGIRDTDGDEVGLILNTVIEMNNKRRVKRQKDKEKQPGNNHIQVYLGHGKDLKDISNQEHEAYKQRWSFIHSIVDQKQNEYIDSEEFKYYIEDHGVSAAYNSVPMYLVVTAHHLNDQIESTLMNLMRGKPHDELSMKQKIAFGKMFKYKPMLEIPKNEIIEQATKRDLEWIEDSTNTDNKNERNWMRNVIIPQLQTRRNLETSMASGMKKSGIY